MRVCEVDGEWDIATVDMFDSIVELTFESLSSQMNSKLRALEQQATSLEAVKQNALGKQAAALNEIPTSKVPSP
ncbi:hypothetical protein Pelo_12923 [Pelomyxa schiedti]|nr:hypothetical protein Pelo_12923 [Pelomyxa schiedti]